MTELSPYLSSLQAALAGEHAAVWACGRAAAELTGSARAAALEELDTHRATRDDLVRTVVSLEAQPVQAAAAYAEPFPVRDGRSARRLLAHVDSALAATYADLAAASPVASRREPAIASSTSAVRAIGWGADPTAFPGQS